MTKLVIQIPCFNEEHSLGKTLEDLPRELPGISTIEWLIIDDGSTDDTIGEAQKHGVDHIVRFGKNRGLAKAFMAGLDASLNAGADVIVNTDADNQYCAADIPQLIAPVLSGEADMVIGNRDTRHFSASKRAMLRLGSWVVRQVSKTEVPDAPSGFRAISRGAAQHLKVFTDYTYTLETIIQAGLKGMAVTSVPVRTNTPLRPSRLIRSLPRYISASGLTIIRIFIAYRPMRFFMTLGVITFVPGFLIGCKFVFEYIRGTGRGHVQSLILAGLLMGAGFVLWLVALISDLISVNRMCLEEMNWRLHKLEENVDGRNDGR
jgi:glycosyltransferase involved in cell wall biosynthesis